MMWLPNPLSLYHKEGFLVSKDFYSTASSGGLFALKLTKMLPIVFDREYYYTKIPYLKSDTGFSIH